MDSATPNCTARPDRCAVLLYLVSIVAGGGIPLAEREGYAGARGVRGAVLTLPTDKFTLIA
jgi:hypothetical protein